MEMASSQMEILWDFPFRQVGYPSKMLKNNWLEQVLRQINFIYQENRFEFHPTFYCFIALSAKKLLS